MVYVSEHDCNFDCKRLTAYIRIEGKWVRIGHYGSGCKEFEHLDLEQEEKDKQLALKSKEINNMIKQTRKENQQKFQSIKNHFNISKEFFDLK